MRSGTARLLVVAALLTGGALPSPVAAASTDGSILWGAYTPGAPFDPTVLEHLDSAAGKRQSIVSWGQPWMRDRGLQPFQTAYFQSVRARGSIPLLTWGSWDLAGDADQPNFRLAKIVAGDFDGYISQWANDARAWGQPFFLRFDYEMNGWWQFPWAAQANGNTPGDYVRAWQHVHDVFRTVGASNVTWIWCPNIAGPLTTPLSELYPGDGYVDWTCLDGYNWGTDKGNIWQSFAQVFGGADYGGYNPHNSYKELLAIAPSKPILLGEVSSSENGGSKAVWIDDMLQTQLPTNFPQIKAVVWMNWNVDDPTLTWQIGSSDAAAHAFFSGIRSKWYAGEHFGGLPPRTIQPPSSNALGFDFAPRVTVTTDR